MRITHKFDHLGANVVQYLYSANSLVTNRWTPQKGNTQFRYDPVGNLTNVMYQTSGALGFRYDAHNRLTNAYGYTYVPAAGSTA